MPCVIVLLLLLSPTWSNYIEAGSCRHAPLLFQNKWTLYARDAARLRCGMTVLLYMTSLYNVACSKNNEFRMFDLINGLESVE